MLKNYIERRNAEYEPLIETFKKEIAGLNINGITGPHFPAIGECYAESKYKFAFCGIETYGWHSLDSILSTGSTAYLQENDKCINTFEYLGWAANYHATFWGFVLKFFSKFFNVDINKMKNSDDADEDIKSIMRSFIWANTNSIERFGVSSEGQGAKYDDWVKVKNASKTFDNINHILNPCAPQVVFIISSNVDEKYYLNDGLLSEIHGIDESNKINVLKLRNDELNYDYLYLRNSNTHIFKLPHPTWMGLYSGIGIERFVDSLIADIKTYHVWDTYPESQKDWKVKYIQEIDKSSRENKFRIVASIAHSLVQNSAVMCGQDLASLLNMNGIVAQNGTPYAEDSGRGIYTLISKAWAYYHEKGDFQTAYDIARSYVNKNGEYAY